MCRTREREEYPDVRIKEGLSMKHRLTLAGLALTAAFLVAFAVAPAVAAAPAHSASHRPTVQMTATITNQAVTDGAGNAVGVFNGTARITHVDVVNGHLAGSGTVTGTLTRTDNTTQMVSDTFTNALIDPPATCTILDLTLGPLHLNLLGLVIDLNQVHLTITAVPGPGNLLGNLLCAVANLLNNTGGLSAAIQNLLNQINAILAGL